MEKEPLDQVTLAIEAPTEARIPLSVGLGRDVGRGILLLDQFSDAVGVIGFVGEHDGARSKMIEQSVGDLPVVRLPGGAAEPDRETLRVDDDVNLGRKPASRST